MQDNYSRALGEYNRMAKDGFDKRMKAAGCSDQLLKEAKAKSRLSGDAPDVYDAFVATRWARYMLAHPMEVARAAAPLLARLSDMPRLTQPCPPELGDALNEVALRTVLEKKIGDQNAACSARPSRPRRSAAARPSRTSSRSSRACSRARRGAWTSSCPRSNPSSALPRSPRRRQAPTTRRRRVLAGPTAARLRRSLPHPHLSQTERYKDLLLRLFVSMLATAVKHEWEKKSPVLSFEVNGSVLQSDWSNGKDRLVNVFSIQCDRDTAVRELSPQGAVFTPGKIDMERWATSHLATLLRSVALFSGQIPRLQVLRREARRQAGRQNFVAKPLPTCGKRKAESAVVEFNQLKAVPLRQTVLPLNPKDLDESIDHELTSQVHLLASSGIPCVPTRTCTLRYR